MKSDIYASLLPLHKKLENHKLYESIKNLDDLKVFMECHVFAVWDFMSLLKRLQIDITCTSLPWTPSFYSKKLVRLINEIVLGEESDKDQNGNYSDHFSLYLKAMQEIKANPDRLLGLLSDLNTSKWCTPHEKEFVDFNLDLAQYGKLHEVAAAFFFGREKLIPDMFTSILNDFEKNFADSQNILFPHLKYYLERHVEIDGVNIHI